ncbi:GNAT family N-acetyltransferase [Deinococcus cellulosilyticus]|uniref:Kanamycin resistance protein n=1 Tax=Deinococcus cellulosilyticus (strain DSM 18568 / NBRC 106333 / KACC 11606 / 5516J-15) TaxID=1223518 RepID=A0A511N534_DEIC1|nr:GNAT family N-acetyltransferase [Deinococcus cellulosilyticus]GEM47954.1 kanamycin resistance protein [Deinococcus cellulosilyticus NBRC 106333 = KACC 11606]
MQIRYGRVELKRITELTVADWRLMHAFFRDRELADWNGARPVRLPLWLFKRILLEEEQAGDKWGFGIYTEGRLIGSVELYHLQPAFPVQPTQGTLGIMIGDRTLLGHGYGREALMALAVYAFQQLQPPLDRIRLTTFLHNVRAQRCFARVGFQVKSHAQKGDSTSVNMELTRLDFLKQLQSGGEVL